MLRQSALPLSAVFMALVPVLILSDLAAGTLSWHCVLTYLLILPLCYALPLLAGPALLPGRLRFA